MSSDESKIKKLRKLVRALKAENEYLKSDMYLLEIVQGIQGEYSVLLNPPPQEFSTTKNQKSCTFKIRTNEIVCIDSDGKYKSIYFIRKQVSILGAKHVSDKLNFTGKIETFCKKYDPAGIHLCKISKSVAVNPLYYCVNSMLLQLIGDVNPQNYCNNIPVSPKFLKEFTERKASLDKILSFQKFAFRAQ